MLSDEVVSMYLEDFDAAGQRHAKALGELYTMEHMRPVVRAKLMNRSNQTSAAKQEAEALGNFEYEKHITSLAIAKEAEARAKYEVERMRYRIELLRTREASKRTEIKHL